MTHERWRAFLVVAKLPARQPLPCRRRRKSRRAARRANTRSESPQDGPACPLHPDSRRIDALQRTRAMCHVWTAPGWQELSSRLQHWSVQPCVRPVCAAHMTVGHNALHGSGPGQKPAFDDALARVGCADRRIDRPCIMCCSPSQPSHHAGCRRDLAFRSGQSGAGGTQRPAKPYSLLFLQATFWKNRHFRPELRQ
jgi:hypothetical protein